MLEAGLILNGRYELLSRVGSGGMATVYKARDHLLGRIVAVKMLHESLTSDEDFLRRFQREAHAAANLTHPNIVTVHDLGQDGFRHYMVMEFVDGQTLKQIIREQGELGHPMPVGRALDLAIQICQGIGYAHRANLVHCDVKPQNVLVTRDDRVKVADFGIARALSQATRQEDSQVWGTPQYFSPEQAAGKPATPATDVYAIGIVLFEMLSSRLPFSADTPTAVALKHLNEPPPPVSEFNPAVPRQLEQIITKVLSKESAGRYRTAGQLGRILSTYRERSLATTGPSHPVAEQTALPVFEQKTQIYERVEHSVKTRPPRTSPQRLRHRGTSEQSAPPIHVPAPVSLGTDWIAVTLGLAALAALLGLIPLWYLVYRAWAG